MRSKFACLLLCGSLSAADGCNHESSIVALDGGTLGADAARAGSGSADAANSCVASGGKCLKQGTGGCLEGNGEDCGPGSLEEGIECCTKQIAACVADGSSHPFHLSDYDQSCRVDSDCVAVGEGDLCQFPCEFFCSNAGAINATAAKRYQADIDALLQGASGICHCPALFSPRCVEGVCQRSSP